MSQKPSNHNYVFCVCSNPLVKMTMLNSARGIETSFEVFPDTLPSFAHPDKLRMDFLTYPTTCPTMMW